jgi:hypothetical protein
MTRVWTVKNGNGEPLLHLASGSPLAVGRKLVPATTTPSGFRSLPRRALLERAVKQILGDQDRTGGWSASRAKEKIVAQRDARGEHD